MQGIAAFVRRAGEKTHVTSRLEPGTWVLHGRRETASGKTASPETANLQRIPATPEQCVPVHKQSKRQSSAACAYIIDAEDRGRWRHTPAKTKAIAFWERAKFIPKERRIPAFSATVSPPLRPGSGYVHLAFTQLRCAGLSFCGVGSAQATHVADRSVPTPAPIRGPYDAERCTSCNSEFDGNPSRTTLHNLLWSPLPQHAGRGTRSDGRHLTRKAPAVLLPTPLHCWHLGWAEGESMSHCFNQGF